MDGLIAEGFHDPYDHACWPEGPNANDGPFDCVNKPQYGCQEQVTIAGTKCSLCHVSKIERPVTYD